MKSQITTGRGDNGQSDALDGERYAKSHPLMECVGTVDELRAHLALLRLIVMREKPAGYADTAEFLLWLLRASFAIGTACSDPANRRPERHSTNITRDHLESIEAEQLRLERERRIPESFVVSAANLSAAHADLARTVARRLERRVVTLTETTPSFDAAEILAFVNRLSDYLFVLGRYFEQGRHITLDRSPIGRTE